MGKPSFSLSHFLLALGFFAALGPGLVLPNEFDMLWRLGGCVLLLIAWMLHLSTLRGRSYGEASENEDQAEKEKWP